MRKLRVKVVPNSKRNEIVKEPEWLRISVSVPARKGQANRKALALLAEYLQIPGSQLEIVEGKRSRLKVVGIGG